MWVLGPSLGSLEEHPVLLVSHLSNPMTFIYLLCMYGMFMYNYIYVPYAEMHVWYVYIYEGKRRMSSIFLNCC